MISNVGGMLSGVNFTPSKKTTRENDKRATFLSRICMKTVKCRLERDAENCLPDNSCEKGLATNSQIVCEFVLITTQKKGNALIQGEKIREIYFQQKSFLRKFPCPLMKGNWNTCWCNHYCFVSGAASTACGLQLCKHDCCKCNNRLLVRSLSNV